MVAQMGKNMIKPLGRRTDKWDVGAKAKSLSRLKRIGFNIPLTYTCGWNIYERFIRGEKGLLDDLRGELTTIIKADKKYAVRSSSNMEDSVSFSFAGQFESLLNVQTVDGVLNAIVQIWEDTCSEQLLSYLNEHGLDPNRIKMGVIVQEMVKPELSGVILTRNPVTFVGETIIEAVAGYGDQLMQKGSNALRWVVKDGMLHEEDSSETQWEDLVLQLATDAIRIKDSLKMDVDVEWVFDGQEIYYVQSRPISSLSTVKIYSNRISRDMLPGMIKPLIWSVNIPLVNSVWLDILESIVGPLNIQATDLAHAFYYRTYFNMGIFGEVFKSLGMPSDALEKMMGLSDQDSSQGAMRPGKEIVQHIPRILWFIAGHLNVGRQIKRKIGRTEANLADIDINAIKSKTPGEIFSEIDDLKEIVKKIAYYNIVTPLLMGFHNRMLKRHLEKVNVDFLKFDLMETAPENNQFDPNFFLERLNRRYKSLPAKTQKELLKDPENALKNDPQTREFYNDLSEFIQQFGHFSDSGNDFSYSPWRENRKMIMRMVAEFERSEEVGDKVSFDDINTGLIRRVVLRGTSRNARKYRMLRERVSSNYIFGYGIFRYYFLALGDMLKERNLIEGREDIFYLSEKQIKTAFERGHEENDLKKIVKFHKGKMLEQENITPPELIYGDNEPILDFESQSVYQGIPASAGFYKGTACVIKGVEEFKKIKQGDVLIIPFSDVGWTPLFPKAGAVVSESGGMLSHCAIVAREYGIPSIVSALGVMKIADGQTVTVDANAGVLYIN